MGKPAVEWICAGLGLIITAGTFLIVARDLGGSSYGGPEISLTVDRIDQQADGYLVHIRAKNVSGTTASAYRIEGTLSRGENIVERSEVTFDYVPRGSSKTGGLWFRDNPNSLDLQLRSLGYQDP